VDALEEDNRTASEAMAYINELHHIENEAKAAGLSYDEMRDKRKKEAYPVILQFEKWMYVTTRKSSEQRRIGKAIKYTLPLMHRLGCYVGDGRCCVDNKLVKKAGRALDLVWVFGHHNAAVRAAIVYSLISSGKAVSVDPRE